MQAIADSQRLEFLPSLAAHFIALENLIYNLADDYAADYRGGYWEFYAGGFMAPTAGVGETVHVVNADNYFEGDLSPIEFGMGVTLIALSRLTFMFPDDDRAADSFYALREFIFDNEPSPELLSFID